MTKPLIYLDMDGVVANFIKGVGDLVGVENFDERYLTMSREKGLDPAPWDMAAVLGGLTDGELWIKIDSVGAHFWSSLEETKEYHELMRLLSDYRIVFVSCPSLRPACTMGKVLWLQRRFGPDFKDYILSPLDKASYLDLGKGILIDDHTPTIKAWTEAGGMGILFPRPWNTLHGRDPLAHVSTTLGLIEQGRLEWSKDDFYDKTVTELNLLSADVPVHKKILKAVAASRTSKKPRPSLLPWESLRALLEVFELGAQKYEVDDWKYNRQGNKYQFDKAMRHLMTWWLGEDLDPEDGQHHLIAVAFHALTGHWHYQNASAIDERNEKEKTT